jgi:RNA polymerase sigma-70 factor (ECF subfamily)
MPALLPTTRATPGDDGLAEGDLADLVQRAARGEQAALGALHDRTANRVFAFLLAMLRDPTLAEEAAVETYVQAWRQSASYDPGRGSVWAWLLTMARTRALDLKRARLRRSSREDLLDAAFEPVDPAPDPEQSASGAQRAARVRLALDGLPESQRCLIEAAYFGGLSHSELAETFAAPLGTVKTRIRSGLAALRRLLGPEGGARP